MLLNSYNIESEGWDTSVLGEIIVRFEIFILFLKFHNLSNVLVTLDVVDHVALVFEHGEPTEQESSEGYSPHDHVFSVSHSSTSE